MEFRNSALVKGCLALALGAIALSGHGTATAGQIYTCLDAQGRRLSSDRPIPECQARQQNLLNRDGSVRTVVPPSLTLQEQAAREEARRQAEQLRQEQEEALRRDRALLRRYPDRASHDQARAKALEPVHLATDATLKRLTQLEAELAQVLASKTLSADVMRQRKASVDASIATQRNFLRARQQEAARINKQMDEDRERLEPFWAELASASTPAAGARNATTSSTPPPRH